jgi:hypothetical protein
MLIYLGVLLLSASALAFEIVLSRLFSITQFYHFAFMTVSLALLGAGASGTAIVSARASHVTCNVGELCAGKRVAVRFVRDSLGLALIDHDIVCRFWPDF